MYFNYLRVTLQWLKSISKFVYVGRGGKEDGEGRVKGKGEGTEGGWNWSLPLCEATFCLWLVHTLCITHEQELITQLVSTIARLQHFLKKRKLMQLNRLATGIKKIMVSKEELG